MIANEGRWPSELNDYDSIRDALLPFCHIVSLRVMMYAQDEQATSF